MALRDISLPDTLQGTDLILTEEQEEICKVLYRNINDNLYEFAGFYDPEVPNKEYPDGLIALSVKSVLRDVRYLNAGTRIWNVVGSTGDPWYSNLHPIWVDIWENELRKRHYPHIRKCYVEARPNVKCPNMSIYGGHVVLTNDTSPGYGDDNTVYIVPICSSHNNRHNTNAMILSEGVWALVLDKYHKAE